MANQSNTFGAVSVSGGFNVLGNQFNGNVSIAGLRRDDPDGLQCLRLLKSVDPENVRRRILTVKDQLVTASYSWILEDETFRSWLDEDTNRLLWIKGGPGKGKTMMMAGLVDVLSEARNSQGAIAVSYFFCQNSDTELRTVSSIVKGLIYMLAFREKTLVDHLKRKFEAGGEEVFTGPRALFALWHVLEDMLRDFHGTRVYLIVDGLDECNDPELDGFLYLLSGCNSTAPGKVKWLVTSRPLPRIEDIIGPDQDRHRISLEIEAQHVSQGVETFINEKVNLLRLKRSWSEETAQTVHSYLQKNAEGTFLWVALVCQRLRGFPPWKVKDELTKLASLQRGLDPFYERMMQAVRDEIPEYADLCMNILRTTTLAYRPLRLPELGTVVALPHELQSVDSPNFDALRDLIDRCGSFILLNEGTIYFVHQSAKEYLSGGSGPGNISPNLLQEHSFIAERCLDTLILCLKDHEFPDPASLNRNDEGEDGLRLLSRIAYACSYWMHHTVDSVTQISHKVRIPNQGKIFNLLNFRLIAWVHALGSLKEVTACIRVFKAVLDMHRRKITYSFILIRDTYRFLRRSRYIVEESPNQAYTSALLFAPGSSQVRKNYQNRIPKWIRLTTRRDYTWDACVETLQGDSGSLVFSSDGSLLASGSSQYTRLWETETGKCRGVIDNYTFSGQIAFSPDDRVLVSVSQVSLVLLDTTTGSQQRSPVGSSSMITRFLFAPNSQILAVSNHNSAILWNIFTGARHSFVELHVKDMVFSHDSKSILIASGSDIEIRDLETSNIVATFREHYNTVISIQFSPDSDLVLSVSSESIWLWVPPATQPRKKLEGYISGVKSAKFSPNGCFIVSTHETGPSLILWETATGNKLHAFTVPLPHKFEPMFTPDSKVMVTPLSHGAKSWDTRIGVKIATFEASDEPSILHAGISICSNDGNYFAQNEGSITRIWEVATGTLLDTLVGHSDNISALEFSPTGSLVASASEDGTVKLWEFNRSTSNRPTFQDPDELFGHIITLSSDGTLAASASEDEGIRLWDLESGSSKTLIGRGGPLYAVYQLAISPDKSLLAGLLSGYTEVWIWETKNGSSRYNFKISDVHFGFNSIRGIAFSPDSRLLKIEFADGSIQLVENHTRAFENVQKPSYPESTQSQNSPDGRFLFSLDPSARAVCLCEQQNNTEQAMCKFELGRAGGVATFSPDSMLIAFVSSEGFISVWETETGACRDMSSNLKCCTRVVSFSHDNRFIAYTSGYEHNLGLLELSTGISRALAFDCADPIKLATFSPDASIVAAALGSTIVLWETSFESQPRKFEYDEKLVSDIAFLSDQNILIAGYEHGLIRFLDANNYVELNTLCTKDRPPQLSLDSKRKFLWTGDQGFFLDEVLQPCKKPAISVEDNWVLFQGERVFWLPTNFRPCYSTWAVSDRSLAMGNPSSDLTIVYFDI